MCRPPGQHATRDRFGGYCYLNHAALVAQRLAAHGPVAIIDVDYHHGNGTLQIFYRHGTGCLSRCILTPSGNTHCSGDATTKPVAVMAWVPRSTRPCPLSFVQKGGYALRALGDLAMRFLRPFS